MSTPPVTAQRPPSNFTFLKTAWPDLAVEAIKAERNAAADPRGACFYARRAVELALHWLYDVDATLSRPYKDDLSAMLFEPSFQTAVDQRIRTKLDFIRREGNRAAHDRKPIKQDAAVGVVKELFHVMYWLARTYARDADDAPHPSLAFELAAIPRPPSAEQRQASIEALRKREEENARRDAELERARAINTALQVQLEGLRTQVAIAKVANELVRDTHDYNEKPATAISTCCCARPAGRSTSRDDSRSTACPTSRARASSTTCCGATTASRSAVVEAKRTRQGRAGRPAAGQALRRLPGGSVRPAAGDLLHQRLRALDLGRRALPAAPGAGLLQEGRAGAADPAPHERASARGTRDRPRRSSSATTSSGRSGASARRSSATTSARRCW